MVKGKKHENLFHILSGKSIDKLKNENFKKLPMLFSWKTEGAVMSFMEDMFQCVTAWTGVKSQ